MHMMVYKTNLLSRSLHTIFLKNLEKSRNMRIFQGLKDVHVDKGIDLEK